MPDCPDTANFPANREITTPLCQPPACPDTGNAMSRYPAELGDGDAATTTPSTLHVGSSTRHYLEALLSPPPPSIYSALVPQLCRTRSLPAITTQCFRCLSFDHQVTDCHDPFWCHSCLRFGHWSFGCTMSGSASPLVWTRLSRRSRGPRWLEG